MPIPNEPHLAALPWLAALAGTFAVHLGMPYGAPPDSHCAVAEPTGPAEPAADRTPEVIEHVIDKADFDRLRADARQLAIPSDDGLRLRGIRPGSLFAELGFESGDLVVDIAGGDATRFRVLRGRARRPIEIVLRIG
jgi:hypothetical protein